MTERVEYWSDIAARDPAWCIASPDGTGPHRLDDTNGTCAECGQDLTCIAGDHYPNDDGTACYYCGLPAETVAPGDLAAAWGRVAAGLPED